MSTEGRVSPAAEEAFGHLVEKLESVIGVVLLAPRGRPHYKIALQLGAAIFLDKPIVLVLPPGATIPARLRMLAAAVLDGVDVTTSDGQAQLTEALAHLVGEWE